MPTSFTRTLARPEDSTLLVGPRATGKSTWIRQHFAGATTYDLLDTRLAMRFARQPSGLTEELDTCRALALAQISGTL